MLLGPNTPSNTQPAAEDGSPAESVDKKNPDNPDKKRWTEFRQRIDISKAYKRKLIPNWRTNIDFRRGKTFSSQDDQDNIAVNLDWGFTKTKQAELFSQVPKVRIDHSPESVTAGPWVAAYERRLNDNMVIGGIEAAMDEVIPDCVNAAGIGIILVARETLSIKKKVPKFDLSLLPPEIHAEVLKTGKLQGQEVPMIEAPQLTDSRYTISRVSPSDFLWPTDFSGSSFDQAPWLGYSGRIPWVEAMKRFGLQEAEKEKYVGEDIALEDRLSDNYERDHGAYDDKVGFDELFYHEYQYNPEIGTYGAIHHLVFIDNKLEPVIDEPWAGQKVDPETGEIQGARKIPLRVLTLNYISDDDIPPSDSAVARPQVKELNRGRTTTAKQRARNFPINWFDVNRLDFAIQNAVMRGVQGQYIPVQGDGSKVIGSIQQSALPQETYLFDKIAKQDAQEIWNTGSNQAGGGEGIETAKEANIVQNNVTTKLARERAKVVSLVIGVAEVMGGFMCLYEDPSMFGEGFDPSIAEKLQYSILADSTVLVDANQRLAKLKGFINDYATSGWINLEPVLKEITSLVGLDPTTVVVAPKEKAPEPPNISLRITGSDDIMNPILLAFMKKAGLAPEQPDVDWAKNMIQSTVTPQPPAQPGIPPQGPAGPLGASPQGAQGPGGPSPLPGQPPPPQAPPAPGTANQHMEPLPQVNPQLKPTPSGR